MTGVCKDKDDNGESKECQPHENLCFYTKTGNFASFYNRGSLYTTSDNFGPFWTPLSDDLLVPPPKCEIRFD